MKLRKNVQLFLEIVAVISFILLATTIESEWCFEYLLFLFINSSILVGTSFILSKFGRWE